MEKGIQPGTKNRTRFVQICREKGVPLSAIAEATQPMRQMTDSQEEQFAAELIEKLCRGELSKTKHYTFHSVPLLSRFIATNESALLGQKLINFYSACNAGHLSQSPFVFAFEQLSIIVRCHCDSSLSVDIVETQRVLEDMQLRFLNSDAPADLHAIEIPCLGQRISGVEAVRFRYFGNFELKDGESPPMGYDDFNTITIMLDNDPSIRISGNPTPWGNGLAMVVFES